MVKTDAFMNKVMPKTKILLYKYTRLNSVEMQINERMSITCL
jgi:hypothetical protein